MEQTLENGEEEEERERARKGRERKSGICSGWANGRTKRVICRLSEPVNGLNVLRWAWDLGSPVVCKPNLGTKTGSLAGIFNLDLSISCSYERTPIIF